MKLLKPLLIMVYMWLMPIKPALISVMALPMIDLLLALIGAFRRKEPITSSGLKRTVGKVLMYEFTTILAFVVETYLLDGFIPVIKIVTGLIGMVELKSCIEHLNEINGNPIFAMIIAKLTPDQIDAPPDQVVKIEIDKKDGSK